MTFRLLHILIAMAAIVCSGISATASPVPGEIVAPADTIFMVSPVSDSVYASMQGRSMRKGAPVSRADLREVWVSHHDLDGNVRTGLIICHRYIAADLLAIFRELYSIGYPIAGIRPVDEYGADDDASMRANNTSCFNFRPTSGGSRLSQHAYGTAIDINPLLNPYVRRSGRRTVVLPAEGRPYADRKTLVKGMISADDPCVAIFKKHGFRWGGDWRGSIRDYQHFEKRLPRR